MVNYKVYAYPWHYNNDLMQVHFLDADLKFNVSRSVICDNLDDDYDEFEFQTHGIMYGYTINSTMISNLAKYSMFIRYLNDTRELHVRHNNVISSYSDSDTGCVFMGGWERIVGNDTEWELAFNNNGAISLSVNSGWRGAYQRNREFSLYDIDVMRKWWYETIAIKMIMHTNLDDHNQFSAYIVNKYSTYYGYKEDKKHAKDATPTKT